MAATKSKGRTGSGSGKATSKALTQPIQTGSDGKCSARKRGGGYCSRPAGWGTDHVGIGPCKLHGGTLPNVIKNVAKRRAAELVEQYGLPREVDPFDALLEELARTAGHVDWLRLQIGGLDEEELTGPVGQEGMNENGQVAHPRTEPSVWIRLYQAEREHLTKVASSCISAGIEERRVKMAEQQGQMIAGVLQGVLNELGVVIDARVREAIRKHLALAGEAKEITA